MGKPTITAIIPTQGRPTLERALASARDQMLPGDEVIVVIDSHGMPDVTQGDLIARIGRYIRLNGLTRGQIVAHCHDAGAHHWGHPQIEAGQAIARGD